MQLITKESLLSQSCRDSKFKGWFGVNPGSDRHRLSLQILDRDLLAVSIEILSVTFFGADGLAPEPIPVVPLGFSPSLDVKPHL